MSLTVIAVGLGVVLTQAESIPGGEVLEPIREYGAIAVLVAFAVLWSRGKLFNWRSVERIEAQWENRYNDMREDRDGWRELALTSTDGWRQAVDITARVAPFERRRGN